MMELRSGRVVSAEAYPETLVATVELLNKLHLAGVTVPLEEMPRVLKLYSVEDCGSASRALAAVVGDAGLISTAGRRTTRVLAEHCLEVYAYEFDVRDTPCPWPEVSFSYGSAHTLELPYIFPGFRGASGKHTPLSEAQQRLATEMVRYWTAFAWHGTPNGRNERESSVSNRPTQPQWEAYNAGSDNVMLFQAAEHITMIEDWGRRHNSNYWDQFY